MILGLSGYARAGKDTVADFLVSEYGFKRLGFADILRESIYILNPVVGFRVEDFAAFESHTRIVPVRVQEVIDRFGWTGYKEHSPYAEEIRDLLQRFGTDVGRNLLGKNIWVEAAFRNAPDGDDYVISDCRFPNEAGFIEGLDGYVFRVERKTYGPINKHSSETALDDRNFYTVLHNDGTMNDLYEDVASAMADIYSTYKVRIS